MKDDETFYEFYNASTSTEQILKEITLESKTLTRKIRKEDIYSVPCQNNNQDPELYTTQIIPTGGDLPVPRSGNTGCDEDEYILSRMTLRVMNTQQE